MAVDSSLVDALALNFIPGVGIITQRNLVNHFGSPKAVIEASSGELQSISGVGKRISAKILSAKAAAYERAAREIEFVKKHQIKILPFLSSQYPRRLKQCVDAPMVIYYRGNANLDSSRIVSIVGTRNASHYGRDRCRELVEALSNYNDVLVISGLAYGIDSYAHKISVENNLPTVGVLGHGLDQIYPHKNRSLAVKMLDNGGLLSEYPSNTRPDRQNFPKRNRIIAGMADVIVVVEAAIRGGALITAEIANNYNRDVCAFPGNVDSEYSAGCNLLIKSHRANLITRAEDLGYLMDWQLNSQKSTTSQLQLAVSLTDVEKAIFKLIQERETISIDEISLIAGEKQSKLAITLLELEMKGLIMTMPGKIYRSYKHST
jgi:DNA processing protein